MENLIIRPLAEGDAQAVADLINASRISEWQGAATAGQVVHRWREPGFDLAADSWGAFDGRGKPAGVASAYFDDLRNPAGAVDLVRMLWICMHPAAWDRYPGLACDLLQRAMARARSRPLLAPERPHYLGTSVAAGDDRLEALLRAHGFAHVRSFFVMRHERLGELDPPPPVPGVRIEPWTPERDHAAWAALAEAFRDHWSFTGLNYDQF